MRNKLTDELAVCGLNAALALGEYHPERINRLFLRGDRMKAFAPVCKKLAERKRPYKICGDEELEKICKSSHHQGVVAMMLLPEIPPAAEDDLDLWAREGKIGLVLDNIGNDHNLGAIIRSAAFFDVHFVVLSDSGDDSEKTAPLVTTSAYRVAEGGMEHVRLRRVRSTAKFLAAASKKIITIGTSPRARLRIADLPSVIQSNIAERGIAGAPGLALVFGNEETGLSEAVRRQCSCLVRVPGTGLVESLNVAQTAALFMQKVYER